MLILAGVSLNAIVGDNGIITNARKASITQRLVSYKEEFDMNLLDEQLKAGIDDEIFLYAINDDVKTLVTILDDNDVGKIAIYDSKLAYIGDVESEEGIVARDLGYLTMTEEDYNYMLELNIIERAVKKIEEDGTSKIGTAMGTSNYGQVTIAGINYGLGWYIIGNDNSTKNQELTTLGVSNSEKYLMTHAPYIVKYSSRSCTKCQWKNDVCWN